MPTSATPTPLSYADADARLNGALSSVFKARYNEVLFFDGDVTHDGDFPPEELCGRGDTDAVELIVVTGNLTVTGRIALYEEHPSLYVVGRTEAETLEGGEAEIAINDGAFTHMVYGEYNEGAIWTGTVETPWVIDFDHMMAVNASGAVWVDAYGDDTDADFSRSDIVDTFVPEVVGEDGELQADEFLDRLRAGLPMLLSEVESATE